METKTPLQAVIDATALELKKIGQAHSYKGANFEDTNYQRGYVCTMFFDQADDVISPYGDKKLFENLSKQENDFLGTIINRAGYASAFFVPMTGDGIKLARKHVAEVLERSRILLANQGELMLAAA